MISQDGFFLPTPSSSAPINTGFAQPDNNNNTTYPNFNPNPNPNPNHTTNIPSSAPGNTNSNKRKRNLPGTPDPEAEVVALSPRSLMATNRFICEICNKGFQRDQNLQLHRRGHNLPWKLKAKVVNKDQPVKKKVYICPEKSCVHHEPSRALGDLTGIKKHFSRKHGEKKWKCDKCDKKYAVMSDWKAHSKICGTRQYKCDCGTIFSRKDSFITHRAFCDALTEERLRVTTPSDNINLHPISSVNHNFRSADLMIINGAPQSANTTILPPFSGFGPSSSNTINPCSGRSHSNISLVVDDGGLHKPRSLPSWLDHHASPSTNSHVVMDLMASSSCFNSAPAGQIMLPEFSPANLNLFALPPSAASIFPQGVMPPPKEEYQADPKKAAAAGSYLQSCNLISLYNNSSPASTSSSCPSPAGNTNMSATALLQKAAQIGSTRSANGNSTGGLFATALGVMSSSSSSSSSSPSLPNNFACFNDVNNREAHRSHLTTSLSKHQSSGSTAGGAVGQSYYSSGNLLITGDLMYPTSSSLRGNESNNISSYNKGLAAMSSSTEQQLGQSSGGGNVGMRDFLGTLGCGNNNNNNAMSTGVQGGGEIMSRRRMVSQQDEVADYSKFATSMAVGQLTHHNRDHHDVAHHQQEQYMDLMSHFNVGK